MRGHQRICRGARTAGLALTDFQRAICRLVAEQRKEAGDIDVFHDAEAAVHASFDADRRLLELHGYTVETVRELPGFIEAVVRASNDEVRMEWARDSAFRFFPLMEHEDLGLTLHPFDLASNKVLALVGRLEVRDWVDAISSHERLQPLGYLLWAACGKDPGFGPGSLLDHARRTTHYSAPEIAQLAFEGRAPDARVLAVTWRVALEQAAAIIDELPCEQAGTCVLDARARLFRGDPHTLRRALAQAHIRFHEGSLGGAYPRLVD